MFLSPGSPLPSRAIGFDLGETLITYADAPLNWTSLYRDALTRVAGALDVEPSHTQMIEAETVLASFNTRLNPRIQEVDAAEIFSCLLAGWPRSALSDARDRAIAVFFGFFQQSLRVYDETLPVLRQLRANGVRIGVLTDVPYGMPRSFVEQDLANAGLAEAVDLLLTSVEIGERKPSPKGFLRLAHELGIPPEELIFVGNEQKDIVGANAAGLGSVLIAREGAPPDWGQSHTLVSLRELLLTA